MGRHANAPLTPEGRRRLCERVDAGRPIAHVAESGIEVSASTVQRTLKRHDLSRVRDMDPPTGERMRVVRYEHAAAGDMMHAGGQQSMKQENPNREVRESPGFIRGEDVKSRKNATACCAKISRTVLRSG